MQIGNLLGAASGALSATGAKPILLQFPSRYEVVCGTCRGIAEPVPLATPWKVAHPAAGIAIIDLGNRYELEMARKDASVILRNRVNGEEQQLWGGQDDDRVAGLPDWTRQRTYCLADDTKITLSFDVTGADAACLRQINITRGERAVQIRGLEATVADTLEVEQSSVGGQLLDWAIDDGQLYRQRDDQSGWCVAGETMPDGLPARDSGLPTLDGLFSQMLGVFLLTGLLAQKQNDRVAIPTSTTPVQAANNNIPIAIGQPKDSGLNVTAKPGEASAAWEELQRPVSLGANGQLSIDGEVAADIRKEPDVPKSQKAWVAGDTQIPADGDDAALLLMEDSSLVDMEALRAQLNPEEQEQVAILESAMSAVDPERMLDRFVSQAIRTSPGQGVQISQIEALVYQSELELDWSGIYRLQEQVYLLLDDGWAYLDLGLPPADFNVAVSRQLEPRLWTRWRQQDDGYQLLDVESDQWMDLEGSVVTSPDKGLLLDCQVTRSSVSGFPLMGMVTTSSSDFVFYENGRFEASSSSLSTSEGLDSFQSAYVHRDSEGNSSSFTGSFDTIAGELPGVAVTGHSESFDEGADWRGNYFIKGNVIEFHYDSGRVSRELFFIGDDGDLFIKDRIYWREE